MPVNSSCWDTHVIHYKTECSAGSLAKDLQRIYVRGLKARRNSMLCCTSSAMLLTALFCGGLAQEVPNKHSWWHIVSFGETEQRQLLANVRDGTSGVWSEMIPEMMLGRAVSCSYEFQLCIFAGQKYIHALASMPDHVSWQK
jgi:hypothetical protein